MDSTKNNNNTNTNTMHSKATDSNKKNNNNDISMTACVTNKPSCKRTGESNPLLYKAAARNLREYHGVPSMTAGGVEKTMVLLQLRPGRLAAQGLAPKQLLEGKSAADDADADNTDGSSSGSEVEPEQADNNPVSDDSNSNSSDGSDTEHDNIATQDSIGIEAGASKHPIHAVFVAAGVQLQPRETRPLLRALGVGPHRLVKLGLVQREEVRRSRPGGRQSGPPHQHHGRPGGRGHHHHRGGGGMMGRPRGPPPRGPPPHRHGHDHGHGHVRRPAHGDRRRSSSPTHGPPREPFEEFGGLHLHHGPSHHHHHHHHGSGGESEGEAELAMMHVWPRGPPHGMHPPRHLIGQAKGGPRRHGMPMHDRQMHSFHGGRRFHGEGVHSSGGEGENGPGMHMGPGHHAHPRRHPEHHGVHHLGSDRDAAGTDMDHGPVPHRAGRHHHRIPAGLHQRPHGPPPGPPGMRGGMRCEDLGGDFHPRQHQHRHQQQQQQQQQHGRMAAGRAHVHPCHERRAPLQMMPMQAY